jgi:hypothetical protein
LNRLPRRYQQGTISNTSLLTISLPSRELGIQPDSSWSCCTIITSWVRVDQQPQVPVSVTVWRIVLVSHPLQSPFPYQSHWWPRCQTCKEMALYSRDTHARCEQPKRACGSLQHTTLLLLTSKEKQIMTRIVVAIGFYGVWIHTRP